MKKRALSIFLVLFILVAIVGVYAQTIDDQLNWNDQMVYQQFTSYYPPDTRYNAYMNQIAGNLNSNIVDVFGEDKDMIYYVCPSHIGFNAISFHKVIIFDSLLLDSLRFLAMGKVYYGGLDNEYIDNLAYNVVRISKLRQNRMMQPNYYNQNNPFGLPVVPGQLTQEQQARAEKLFKSMLVSWMAHEGSHCMLEHMKQRMIKMQEAKQQMQYQGNQYQFQNSINAYMSAQLMQSMEKEADVHATKWLLKSGYSTDGFITWLTFAEKLEKLMGTENAYLRTHPKCSERIEYIRETERNFR